MTVVHSPVVIDEAGVERVHIAEHGQQPADAAGPPP